MTAEAIVFIVVAMTLCVAAVLAILGTGQLALSGSGALRRDGLARGQIAPAWSLPDVNGMPRKSPPDGPFQLIVFADHSLQSFPSVVAGLRALLGNGSGSGGDCAGGEHAEDGHSAECAGGEQRDSQHGPAGQRGLEIVILTRGPAEQSAPLLRQIGLAGIPVVSGSRGIYSRYNVRVMPFAIFVDDAGRVRASSLINHDWQVSTLRRVAALPLEPGEAQVGPSEMAA
jgi:hypothetical protein